LTNIVYYIPTINKLTFIFDIVDKLKNAVNFKFHQM
jgi:hypothetical protein